jgi:hypothetical protein
MNSCINAPNVDPSKQQGIKTYTRLKFTNDVLIDGCFLKTIEKKLGIADPTTRHWATTVA